MKRHCTRWGRGKKGRKVCRAFAGNRKRRGARKGLRGLSGLSGAALSSLAADLTRCVKYKRTAKGKIRCASLLLGPGAPNARARAARGVKSPYSYRGRKSGRVWGQPKKAIKKLRTKLIRSIGRAA